MEKGYFRSRNKTVKPHAYKPDKQGDCSVFRITNLISEDIWELGKKFVGDLRGKPVIGRSDINVKAILETGLYLIPEISRHERHANINGYPDDPSEEMEIRTVIANNAKLVLK